MGSESTQGRGYLGMCRGFMASARKGCSGLVCWFCSYQLCDLGKVNSLLCVPNLLICKARLTVFIYYSCHGIPRRSG